MTASFDVTHYTDVLTGLIQPPYRYLTLDSKRIRESQYYCRRGVVLILEAIRGTRDYGKPGASRLDVNG